jgi:hypothetical protein
MSLMQLAATVFHAALVEQFVLAIESAAPVRV